MVRNNWLSQSGAQLAFINQKVLTIERPFGSPHCYFVAANTTGDKCVFVIECLNLATDCVEHGFWGLWSCYCSVSEFNHRESALVLWAVFILVSTGLWNVVEIFMDWYEILLPLAFFNWEKHQIQMLNKRFHTIWIPSSSLKPRNCLSWVSLVKWNPWEYC